MVDSRENRRTQPHITQTNYIESIEELNKMDIFVCGSCYFVAHFVEEFISHKEMPCERRDVIQPNTSDQKPQVWSFLLWKNAKHRANTQSSSWQLYQEWCTLPDATKNAWIEAGQFLKISSTMKSCYAGMNSKRFISDGILDEEELSPMKATIPNNPVSNSNKVMKKTRSGKYVELIVEKILAKRINNRRTEYWVKYKGRSAADEFKHWEPIESMSSTCQDMISSFESKAYLGQDSSGRKRTLSQTGNELNSAGLLNNVVGNKQKMEHVKQWVQDDTSGRIHGDDDVAKKKLRTDGSDNDSTEDYEEFFLRQKGGIILRASMKSCPKSTHSGGVTKKKNLAAEIGLESEEEEEEGGKENIFGRKNVPAVLKPNEQKNVSPPPSPPPSTIPSFSRSSQRVKSKRTLSKSSGVHDPAIILDLKKPSNKKSSNLPGKHNSTKTNQKKPYKNVPQSKSLLDEIQSDWVDSDSLPPPEDANSVYDQVECSLASMIQESTEKIGRTRNQKAKATVAMKRTNRKSKRKVQSNEPLINKRNVTKAINEGVNKGDKAFDDSIKNRKCKVINENTNNKKEKTMITINNEKVPLKGEIDLNTGEKNDLVLVTDEKSTSDERGDIQTESNENKVNTVVVQKITKQIAKAKTINNEIKNNRKGKAKVIHDEKINNGNNKTIFKKSKKGKLKEPDSGNIKELNLVTQDDENQSNLVKPIKGSKIDEKRKAKTGKSRNCEAIITPNIPNAVNLDDETISPDANCLDKTDEISTMSPKPEETCLNKKMKLTFKEFLELSKQNSWHKSIEVLRKKSPPKLSKSLNSTCPNLETTLLDNSYSSGFKKVMLTLEEYNTMNNNASEEIVQSPKFQSTICQKNKSVCLDCSTIQSSSTNKVSINQDIVKIKKDLVKPVPKTRLRKRKNVKTKICQVQNSLQDIKKPDSDSNISLRRSVDSVQSWWKLEKCKPKYRSKSTEGSGSYHEDSSLIQNNTVSSSVYSSEISSTTLLTASSRTQNITEVEKEVSETCIGNMVMNTNGESCADDAKIEAQNSGLINCKEDAVHEYIDDNEIEPVSSTIVIAKPKRNRAKGTKMKSENIKKTSASRKKGKKVNMDCEESSKTESSLWAADTELVGEEFLSKLIDSTLAVINDETSNHVKTETTPNETSISIIETESVNVNDMHTCDSLDVEKMFNPSKSIVGNHCSSLMEVIPQNMNLLSDKNELNNSTIIHNKNDLSSPVDCKNDLSLDSCCNDDNLVTHCNLSATETFSPNNTQNVNFLSDTNELNFNTTVYNNKNNLSSTSDCKNDLNDNTLVSHYDVSATETFSLNNTESLLSSKEDFNKFVEDNNLNSEVSAQDQGKLNSEYVNAFCLDFLLDSSVENIMTSTPLQNSAVGCVDFIQQNTGTPCAPSAYLSFTPSPSSNPSYHELRGPEPKIPSYDPRNSGLKLPTVRQKFPVINPPGKIKLVKKKVLVVNSQGVVALDPVEIPSLSSGIYIMTNKNEETSAGGEPAVTTSKPAKKPLNETGGYVVLHEHERSVKDTNNEALGRVTSHSLGPAIPPKMPNLTAFKSGALTITPSVRNISKDVTANNIIKRQTPNSQSQSPQSQSMQKILGPKNTTPKTRQVQYTSRSQPQITYLNSSGETTNKRILGSVNRYKATPDKQQLNHTEIQYTPSQSSKTVIKQEPQSSNLLIPASGYQLDGAGVTDTVMIKVEMSPGGTSQYVRGISGLESPHQSQVSGLKVKRIESPRKRNSNLRDSAHISILNRKDLAGGGSALAVPARKLKMFRGGEEEEGEEPLAPVPPSVPPSQPQAQEEMVTIAGEDGTLYQVASSELNGSAVLLTTGEDGQQQCLYVTDENGQPTILQGATIEGQEMLLDQAVYNEATGTIQMFQDQSGMETQVYQQDENGQLMPVDNPDEVLAQVQAAQQQEELLQQQQEQELAALQQQQELGHQQQELTPEQATELLQQEQEQQQVEGAAGSLEHVEGMQVAAEGGEQGGDSEVVAQLVEASEPSADGGPRKVVLLLSDGNLIQTEMSEEQFAALENS